MGSVVKSVLKPFGKILGLTPPTPSRIPEGYEAVESTQYQIFDQQDGPGDMGPRNITLDEYKKYKAQQRTVVGQEPGDNPYTTGPRLGTKPMWEILPVRQQPAAPAPTPAPAAPAPAPAAPAPAQPAPAAAPAPAAPAAPAVQTKPAAGGPQPAPVAAPVSPAAPKLAAVTPSAPVYGSDAQAAGSAGPVFGRRGRRPFRRAPQQLGASAAPTMKMKLGG